MKENDRENWDPEVVTLVDAMNLFEGITTTESCCGHGDTSFRIYFDAESLQSLPPLLYWFDPCHSRVWGWDVRVYTDCGMRPACFVVESTRKGGKAYSEALSIAKVMRKYLKKEERKEGPK